MENKHTQAFAKQVQAHIDANMDFQKKVDFVKALSTRQHNNACSAIVSAKGTMKVSTNEIFQYCIKNNIKPQGKCGSISIKEELAQQQFDFDAKQEVDYTKFECADEITLNGKSGLVMDNDVEKKELCIEYEDGEMEVFNY
jgi:hypothetical protein